MTDLEALCRACGMCCDGSLFGRARLDPDEVASAKKNRLHVVANEGSFSQECSALVDGGCAIYEERPRACRAFVCRLLYEERPRACRAFVCRLHERLRTEGGDVTAYIERVRRARELLVHLAESGDVDSELATLLDEDFARA
jgi:uncharacterized protein